MEAKEEPEDGRDVSGLGTRDFGPGENGEGEPAGQKGEQVYVRRFFQA